MDVLHAPNARRVLSKAIEEAGRKGWKYPFLREGDNALSLLSFLRESVFGIKMNGIVQRRKRKIHSSLSLLILCEQDFLNAL